MERLKPTRSLTHHPLVQVMLAWQNFAWQDSYAAGLTLGDLAVVAAMAADPMQRLRSVDVLDDIEHDRLNKRWGNRAVLTQRPSAAVSVPVLFAAQVARTPEATATDRAVSYRELDEAADRLRTSYLDSVRALVGVWPWFWSARLEPLWPCWRC